MINNLKKEIYKGFLWEFIGKIGEQGIGFFIAIFLARLLDPQDFGLVAMASVVISLASVITDSGLSVALIQRKEVTDYHYGSVFYFNLFTGGVLTILFFLLSGVIADFYNQPVLKPIIKVLSLNFIIDSFIRVKSAWLKKKLKFNILNKAKILSFFLGGIVGVVMAFFHYGAWALVFQSITTGIIRNIYIIFFSGFKLKLKYSFKALKELWTFGGRVFFLSIISTIVGNIDSVIIGKVFKATTLGFYQRAKSLNEFIQRYTSGTIMPVLFPTLSFIKDEKERYLSLVDKGFHLLSFVSLFFVGLMFVISKDIIVLLFSEKWLPSVVYLKILLLGGFIYPISTILVDILSSRGNSKAYMYSGLIKQSLFLLNLTFGFLGGIKIYLYGFVFVNYISLFVSAWYAGREIDKNMYYFIKKILPYFFITGIIVALLCAINKFYPIDSEILHLILYLLVYLLLVFLFSKVFNLKGYIFITNEIKSTLKKYKIL
jgi:teichuronic acid exporter